MIYCPYCMNELGEKDGVCSRCGKNSAEYQQQPHTLSRGVILNNRYLIGGVLGEGGFGITYIGLDTLLQVRVAVKEFFPNGMVNRNNTVSNEVHSITTESAKEIFSKSRDNFLREARTLAKFTNEAGIVSVRDFFEENHTVYIVMEYLEGITLKAYLSQVGTMSPNNTVCLLMPVFLSLRKMHEKKLIHRDISPDNIMLCDEKIKLLDFGAAREFADERSLSVMLKHGYAPMEQYRRHGIQGAWTDVYAICATMYKCVTGKIPPDAPDRVFDDSIQMPSQLGIPVEPEFEKVLLHGLAVKPEDRIQSIDELLEELNAVPGIDIDTKNESKPDPVTVNNIQTENKPANNDDVRLSEYVPHEIDDKPEKRSVQSNTPVTVEKKKKGINKPIIIISAVAAVAVIGGAVTAAVVLGGNKSEDVSEPESIIEASTKTEVSDVVSKIESSQEQSSKEESSKAESSKEQSSKEESSKAESSKEQSSKEESSKAESSKEQSSKEESSKAESSKEQSSKEETSNVTKYPDLGSTLKFEGELLVVDNSLFSMNENQVAGLYNKTGDIYRSDSYALDGVEYQVLYIPIDSPYNTESQIQSIDFYFLKNKLMMIRYELIEGYHRSVLIDQAKTKYGKPVSEGYDSVYWQLKNMDISYEISMVEYENYTTLAQSYTSSGFARG